MSFSLCLMRALTRTQVWENTNGKRKHSEQGPIEDWIEWRDKEFDNGVKNWGNMLRDWRDQPYQLAHWIQYEKLTDTQTGPQLFKAIANELRGAGFTSVAADDDIPCLWYKVVKGDGTKKTKRAPHKYMPGYTSNQLAQFQQMLQDLIRDFSNDTSLISILQEYRDDISRMSPQEK